MKTFEKISEDERETFFKACHGKSPGAVMLEYVDKVQKYEIHEQTYSYGGKFLPLTVWAKKGYDAEAISRESHSRDVMPDRMFGVVYRVPIVEVHERGAKGCRGDSQCTAAGGSSKSSRALEDASAAEMPPEKKKRAAQDAAEASHHGEEEKQEKKKDKHKKRSTSSSRSSSSSSSSSSTERREKRRQKKKSAKDKKKEKARQQKQREEEKKRLDAEKKEAAARAAVVKKERAVSAHAEKNIEKVAQEMDRVLRASGADNVPEELRRQFNSMSEGLWELKIKCGDHAEGISEFDSFRVPADLSQKIEAAKKSSAIFALHTKNFLQQSRLNVRGRVA